MWLEGVLISIRNRTTLSSHSSPLTISILPAGAASIGKGIGGILFSRFSRSNSQPSVSSGLEGGANVEEEEPKQAESQSAYGLSTITRPTSPTADTSR